MPAKKPKGLLEDLKKRPSYRLLPPQLEKESDRDYLFFAYYCFMGFTRSIPKLRAFLNQLDSGHHTGGEQVCLLKKSSMYKWLERASIYDANRLSAEADKLITVDLQLENEWVKKREETNEVLQRSLFLILQILNCNELLVEAVSQRLKTKSKSNLVEMLKISRLLAEASNSTEKNLATLARVWQEKENTEALEAGRQILESALELN